MTTNSENIGASYVLLFSKSVILDSPAHLILTMVWILFISKVRKQSRNMLISTSDLQNMGLDTLNIILPRTVSKLLAKRELLVMVANLAY